MQNTLYWILFVAVAFSFLIGAKVGKETTESDMYHRDYDKCVSSLPRNKDCVAVKVDFKIVNKD